MLLINLTIPLYNEELILADNTKKILDFLSTHDNFNFDWQIILANNASTDQTPIIAQELASSFPPACRQAGVERESSGQSTGSPIRSGMTITYLYIPQKGKGLAVKTAWQSASAGFGGWRTADYYLFMDADLSTDLEALPRLLNELEQGADVVIGSRYLPKSKINRSFLRAFISKTLRLITKNWLKLPFVDLPCGFKGVNLKIIKKILPQVKNNEWFFDTELLYLAHQQKYNIKEIPVSWQETLNQKRKSRVGIIKVSWDYLKEIYKLKKG